MTAQLVQTGVDYADGDKFIAVRNGQPINIKGDSLPVAALNIPNDSITNQKLNNMGAKTFKGNPDPASSSPVNMSVDIARVLLGMNPNKPIVGLFLGQSNQRSSTESMGGDQTVDQAVFSFDNNSLDNTTFVPGTAWTVAAFGKAPLNIGGGPWANSKAFHTCKYIHAMTNRDVYLLQYAAGSHHIESFIPSAVRTAKGWPIVGGNQDLTAFMYPGIANALALIPGAPTMVDFVDWAQGEADQDKMVELYAAQFYEANKGLATANLINLNTTPITTCNIIASKGNPNRKRLGSAQLLAQDMLPTLRIVDSAGLPPAVTDGLHFTGDGLSILGRRVGAALLAAPVKVNYETADIKFHVDDGLRFFTDQVNLQLPDMVDRPAVALNSYLTIENHATLGWCYRVAANSGPIYTSRRLYAKPVEGLVSIIYEAMAEGAGSTVDLRMSIAQFDKNKTFISNLNIVPYNSPLTDATGRTTFKALFGNAPGSNAVFATNCEYFSYTIYMGVGADDETFVFNIKDMSIVPAVTSKTIQLASGVTALDFFANAKRKIVPNATATLTTTVPPDGTECTLTILTSGVTSYTLTFGSGFKSQGTLATGTVDAKTYVLRFVSDGITLNEVGARGIAM